MKLLRATVRASRLAALRDALRGLPVTELAVRHLWPVRAGAEPDGAPGAPAADVSIELVVPDETVSEVVHRLARLTRDAPDTGRVARVAVVPIDPPPAVEEPDLP